METHAGCRRCDVHSKGRKKCTHETLTDADGGAALHGKTLGILHAYRQLSNHVTVFGDPNHTYTMFMMFCNVRNSPVMPISAINNC